MGVFQWWQPFDWSAFRIFREILCAGSYQFLRVHLVVVLRTGCIHSSFRAKLYPMSSVFGFDRAMVICLQHAHGGIWLEWGAG